MLAFLALWQRQQAVEQERQSRTQQLQRELASLKEALGGIEDPDEIMALTALHKQEETRKELLASLGKAEKARREAEKDKSRLQQDKRRLQAALGQERRGHEQAKETISRQTTELLVLKKGRNPPCWYELVPDGGGGRREKPHYTFDIGVFDEHMVIRRREPPPGSAVEAGDHSTTYADEWTRLGLADVAYELPLSDTELMTELQQVHDAGKQIRVRSYPCIFWVRVWDETSADAKLRWQQAHDRTLEWLFGTFRVDDVPWRRDIERRQS